MKHTETTTMNVEQCPTCTRSKYDPFRRYETGTSKILYGCIDDFHTGHLVSPSASNDWHLRKEAKQRRAAVKKHAKLVTGRAIHDYRNCQCFAASRLNSRA